MKMLWDYNNRKTLTFPPSNTVLPCGIQTLLKGETKCKKHGTEHVLFRSLSVCKTRWRLRIIRLVYSAFIFVENRKQQELQRSGDEETSWARKFLASQNSPKSFLLNWMIPWVQEGFIFTAKLISSKNWERFHKTRASVQIAGSGGRLHSGQTQYVFAESN